METKPRKSWSWMKKNNVEWEHVSHISQLQQEVVNDGIKKRQRGTCCVILSVRGTVISAMAEGILTGTIIYPLLIFWVIRVSFREGFGKEFKDRVSRDIPDVDMTSLGIIGGFLSFFLVFFASQSYARFDEMYHTSMALKGQIINAVSLAKFALPKTAAFALCRHLNLAHALVYCGLQSRGKKTYSYESLLKPLHERYALFTAEEQEEIEKTIENSDMKNLPYLRSVMWALEDISVCKKATSSDIEFNEIRKRVIHFNEAAASIFNFGNQPIPFFYVHLLYISASMFMPLFAIAVALNGTKNICLYRDKYKGGVGFCSGGWGEEFLGTIIVFVMTVVVDGLSKVCEHLADPFGGDREDLNVLQFIVSGIESSLKLLELPFKSISMKSQHLRKNDSIRNTRPTIIMENSEQAENDLIERRETMQLSRSKSLQERLKSRGGSAVAPTQPQPTGVQF